MTDNIFSTIKSFRNICLCLTLACLASFLPSPLPFPIFFTCMCEYACMCVSNTHLCVSVYRLEENFVFPSLEEGGTALSLNLELAWQATRLRNPPISIPCSTGVTCTWGATCSFLNDAGNPNSGSHACTPNPYTHLVISLVFVQKQSF